MAIKLKNVLNWFVRKAKEPSTYAGIAVAATIVGKPDLANTIGQVGQAVGLIVGGGLIAHTSISEQ